MSDYQRIPTDVEMGSGNTNKNINIVVKWKESSYNVNISKNATVNDMKTKIENLTEITKNRQRLIFSGKSLKPDSSFLLSFKIVDGSVVQLFPLATAPPVSTPTISTSNTTSGSGNTSSNTDRDTNGIAMAMLLSYMNSVRDRSDTSDVSNTNTSGIQTNSGANNTSINSVNSGIVTNPLINTNTPITTTTANTNNTNTNIDIDLSYMTEMHFDMDLLRKAAAVQWWCVVLSLISVWVLLQGLLVLLTTGSIGDGFFDVFINLCIYFASFLSMHVSKMGIQAGRTMNIDKINIYLKNLISLMSYCIIMRILWVFDMYLIISDTVSQSVNEVVYVEDDVLYDDIVIDGTGTGDGTGEGLSSDAIGSVTIQACAIAMVVILCWIDLYKRSQLFKDAVVNYQAEHEPRGIIRTDTPTGTDTDIVNNV